MSETTPQSLASVISDQGIPVVGDINASMPASSPAPKMPSLEQIISSGNADLGTSGSGDASLPLGSTAAPAALPAAGQSSPSQEQALRALLTSRGFEVPQDYATDDAIADLLVQQLDAASSFEESDDYKKYLNWQSQQAIPQTFEVTAPVTTVAPPAQINESLILNAVSNGYITFDAKENKWGPAHPSFAEHADAMNAREKQQQQIKIQLATDPEGYIQKRIEEALAAHKAPVADSPQSAELKKVLDGLKQQQVQSQVSQIESWAMDNSSKLYDAAKQQTPFYGFYQSLYGDLTELDPTYDQRPLERHNEILRRMQVAEQAFRPSAPPAAEVAPPKPQSFLASVAQRTGSNRLSEYDGPARNSVSPQIPKGPGGMPSLAGIINGQTALN